MKKIRTLLMGTPQIAADIFEGIVADERFEIVGIVSQPDKPVGRKQKLLATPTKTVAEKYGIEIFQPEKASRKLFVKSMNELDIDVAFVVAYGQILKQRFLDVPKHGCINLHGSLLPLYRGASPIQAALLSGDGKSGITYIKMDAGMDSGDMLCEFKVNIDSGDALSELASKLVEIGKKTLADVLFTYVNGNLQLTKQDHDKASYCEKIEKTDGHIDPEKMDAVSVYNRFRAYSPWPGISIEWMGSRIKLLDLKPSSFCKKTDEILFYDDKKLYLQTSTGMLLVSKLQLPGKKPISGLDFLNSYLI